MADFERGTKVAGFRGYFLTGAGAILNMAVWQHAQRFFTDKGFNPIVVPSLLRRVNFLGTGYIPQGEDDLYKTQDADYLAGTAEVGLMGYHMNDVLNIDELPLLKDPDYLPQTDYLIIEATYGNRLHSSLMDMESLLEEYINKTVKRGGKIIIPAFALERTQEIVYLLNILTKEGKIPEIPIFVDSPLSGNLTEVFMDHLECLDEETNEEFLKNKENPFGFGRLRYTASAEESKKLNDLNGPAIIIAASGMCEHGRILHHLKNNIEKRKKRSVSRKGRMWLDSSA
jgi:hypothetical protein